MSSGKWRPSCLGLNVLIEITGRIKKLLDGGNYVIGIYLFLIEAWDITL